MRRPIGLVAALLALLLSSGCGTVFYAGTPTGVFAGKLTVEWMEPNIFIYRPDAIAPLSYTTSDGRKIQPRTMYTDAGSVPRVLWSVPGFGPWDFAPGYIIHDWLFEQHRCEEGDWRQYDFKRSAEILAEAMKSQMEKAGHSESALLWAVYQAVNSDTARGIWDSGQCATPPARPNGAPGFAIRKPVVLRTIEFK